MLFEKAGDYYAVGYPLKSRDVKYLIDENIVGKLNPDQVVIRVRASDIERIFRDKLAPAMVQALIDLAFKEEPSCYDE